MKNKGMFTSNSKCISFSGIVVAIGLLLMWLSSLGIARLGVAFLAAMLTIPLLSEKKYAYSLLIYFATILLGFLLGFNSGLPLYVLFAYYPILLFFSREKFGKASIIIQIIALFLSILTAYTLARFFAVSNLSILKINSLIVIILALIGAVVLWFVGNFLIDKLQGFYSDHIEKIQPK